MKTNPVLWERKNAIMAHKTLEERPGLKIYHEMVALKEEIISAKIALEGQSEVVMPPNDEQRHLEKRQQ